MAGKAFANLIKWSDKMRSRFGAYKLQKELGYIKRDHRFINFSDATNIGVLFDATDETSINEIEAFIKSLTQRNKTVSVLGYWSKKKSTENPLAKKGINYFTRKDVSLLFIPDSSNVMEFIHTSFDILININTEHCFPLQYVSAMSKATLRVGRYVPSSVPFYDLMININTTGKVKAYLEQVNHYLNIINKKETNK